MSDFINNISQKISETAEVVGKKADEIIAVQGLKGQIRTAEREINKNYVQLGKNVLAAYEAGVELPERAVPVCEDIKRLQGLIEQYEAEIEELKKEEEINWDADEAVAAEPEVVEAEIVEPVEEAIEDVKPEEVKEAE